MGTPPVPPVSRRLVSSGFLREEIPVSTWRMNPFGVFNGDRSAHGHGAEQSSSSREEERDGRRDDSHRHPRHP